MKETVDTVDTVDEPSIEIDMTDIEAVEPAAPIPTPTPEPMPEQPEEDFSTPLVPPAQEEAAEPIDTVSDEPQSGSEEVSEPAGALAQQETDDMQWPVGMKGPQFTESLVAYGEAPRKAETEEANVFLYARYNDETGIGSYGLCVDMGDAFVQSSRSGHAPNEEEFALMGAIEMFNAIKERDIHDVVVYTEPELAKAMNENANRLINGKSEVCRIQTEAETRKERPKPTRTEHKKSSKTDAQTESLFGRDFQNRTKSGSGGSKKRSSSKKAQTIQSDGEQMRFDESNTDVIKCKV